MNRTQQLHERDVRLEPRPHLRSLITRPCAGDPLHTDQLRDHGESKLARPSTGWSPLDINPATLRNWVESDGGDDTCWRRSSAGWCSA